MKKLKSKRSLSIFGFFVIAAVLTQFFTNCGVLNTGKFTAQGADSIGLASLSVSHPEEKADAPNLKNFLVNREYVRALLLDVFTSANFPTGDIDGAYLRPWVLNKPGAFGGNCDLYSSESGNDCGGSVANTNLPLQTTGSTLRSISTVAVCEYLLSNDNAVYAALEKTSDVEKSYPNAAAISQVYSLFRRGWDIDSTTLGLYMQLDASLKERGAPPLDRWRLVIQSICEDPAWQAL